MSQSIQIFTEWLDAHKVDRNVVTAATSNLGYGLLAQRRLMPGEVVIRLPKHLLITTGSARSSQSFAPILRLLSNREDKLDGYRGISEEMLVLTLFLLHELSKGEHSLWFPYINLLPKTNISPLFFSEDEFSILKGSPLYWVALDIKEALEDIYLKLGPELCAELAGTLTINDDEALKRFFWAYSSIESRAFKILDNNVQQQGDTSLITALVPLGDLANHVVDTHHAVLVAKGIDPKLNTFNMILSDKSPKCEAGDEVYVKYNDLANWQLLLYYGFAVQNNIFDRVNISLEVPEGEYQTEIKKMILLESGEGDGFGLEHSICAGEEPISENLLGSLRLLLIDGDELEQYNVHNLQSLLSESVSYRNEMAVLETLTTLVNSMLDQYPTTIDEDLKRLDEPLLSKSERYILIYISEQKKILRDASTWLRSRRLDVL